MFWLLLRMETEDFLALKEQFLPVAEQKVQIPGYIKSVHMKKFRTRHSRMTDDASRERKVSCETMESYRI